MDHQSVLYWTETLLDSDPKIHSKIRAIKESTFSALVLGSIHVSLTADLYWNSTPLVVHDHGSVIFDPQGVLNRASENLLEILNSGIDHLFFCLGGGGERDYSNIANLLKTDEGTQKLKSSLMLLKESLPQISGFDFDNEDHHDIGTMVWLTDYIHKELGLNVTYRPYFGQVFWTECLEKVYEKLQKQPVLWWNLQCYEEGKVNNPDDWAHNIAIHQEKNGVEKPLSFIVPGYAPYSIEGNLPPTIIQEVFSNFKSRVGGGFIDRAEDLFNSPEHDQESDEDQSLLARYADAITRGLTETVVVGSPDYD